MPSRRCGSCEGRWQCGTAGWNVRMAAPFFLSTSSQSCKTHPIPTPSPARPPPRCMPPVRPPVWLPSNPIKSGGPGDFENRSPRKSGWGCVLWGCLGSIVLSLLLLIGGTFAAYYAAIGQVKKYTETRPRNFPPIDSSEEEVEAIRGRIEQFRVAAGIGEDGEISPPRRRRFIGNGGFCRSNPTPRRNRSATSPICRHRRGS